MQVLNPGAGCTISHCVLLKHYYSVDFPWWFDRKKKSYVYFEIFFKNSWNQSEESYSNDLTDFFLRVLFQIKKCLQNLQINLEAKRMDGFSWKKNFIISEFTLFFEGQVLFTVNGLNWTQLLSQSWQVVIRLLRKSLIHWNFNQKKLFTVETT